MVFTDGAGFTVILNDVGEPKQDVPNTVLTGVTVTLPVTGDAPALGNGKEKMLPVPLVPNPIAVLLLVHWKVVPVVGPVKKMEVVLPLQSTRSVTEDTTGVGLTYILKDEEVPVHVAP